MQYPHYGEGQLNELLETMSRAVRAWRDAGAEARASLCVEILDRVNAPAP